LSCETYHQPRGMLRDNTPTCFSEIMVRNW